MSKFKSLQKFQDAMFKIAYCSSIAFIALGTQAILTPALLPFLIPIVAVLAASSATCALVGRIIDKDIAQRAEKPARNRFARYSQTYEPRTGRRIGCKEPASSEFNSAAPRDREIDLGFGDALKKNAEMQQLYTLHNAPVPRKD